jgi:outer membrane protein assembly factor BamB
VDGANCPPDPSGKGLLVLKISADPAPAISTAWCNKVVSYGGGPIDTPTDGRSNPIVFGLGAHGDNRLYAYRGDTGELLAPPQPLRGTTKFQTLIAADGRLFVTGGGKVYAFTF